MQLNPIKYCLILVMLALPFKSIAQETSANFGTSGSVQIGYDSRTCNGTTEGHIRYNTGTDIIEFCDGTDWTSNGLIGQAKSYSVCAGVTSFNDVGDTCTDGSIYAGLIYDADVQEHYALYAADADQTSGSWKTSTGSDDIDPDSQFNGQRNHDNRSGSITNFPAFQTCENLSRHSHTDWYLPAYAELLRLHTYRTEIGGFTLGTTTNERYWTSTELSTSDGRAIQFRSDFPIGNTDAKTQSKRIRCVRRD